jgi:nucleotide-binding universal stress UspA family protein
MPPGRYEEWSMYEAGLSRSPRVVVGVHGSLTSLAALRTALQEARDRGAVLVPVLAWSPVGGEFAYRRSPCPELLGLWRTDANQRLATAFDEAFGGYPGEVDVQGQVVRAAAGPTLVQAAAQSGDLLVVGSGHRRVLSRRVHGPTARYCLAHAECAVLLVPPPELLHRAKQRAA